MALILAGCTGSKKPTAPTHSASTATPSATASSSPTATATPTTDIVFSNCTGQFQTAIGTDLARQVSFGCSKVLVPLDYSRPSGPLISIFVVRMHFDRQDKSSRIGSLILNPGGPGESGINYAASLLSNIDKTVLQHFDLIGFDPRGVGLSAPLDCITGPQQDVLNALDTDARTDAGRSFARTVTTAVRQHCVASYGQTLKYYNTEATARDMDRIRSGLGEQQLNYLGFGYGTRLGAAYAHLFPGRLRTAVLDGPIDPTETGLNLVAQRTAALEQGFDRFATDCAQRTACAVLGDVRTTVEAMVAGAAKLPIPTKNTDDSRVATSGTLLNAIVAGEVDPATWKQLGAALVAARNGDASGILALADAFDQRDPQTGKYSSNRVAAETVIGCNDSTTQVTDALVARVAAQWDTQYPLFGNAAAAQLYACYGWPASGQPLPPATASITPPILVIGTVHNPTAPYAAAGLLARALRYGVVLTWNGDGQNAYPRTKCVSKVVDDYLITGTVAAGFCPAA